MCLTEQKVWPDLCGRDQEDNSQRFLEEVTAMDPRFKSRGDKRFQLGSFGEGSHSSRRCRSRRGPAALTAGQTVPYPGKLSTMMMMAH